MEAKRKESNVMTRVELFLSLVGVLANALALTAVAVLLGLLWRIGSARRRREGTGDTRSANPAGQRCTAEPPPGRPPLFTGVGPRGHTPGADRQHSGNGTVTVHVGRRI